MGLILDLDDQEIHVLNNKECFDVIKIKDDSGFIGISNPFNHHHHIQSTIAIIFD